MIIKYDLGECKEYYEDPWIFGEEEEANESSDSEEGAADESGSGEGSGGAVGKTVSIMLFAKKIVTIYYH